MNGDPSITKSIQPYADLDELHAAAANAFCQLVDATLAASSVVRVALSGGSTPRGLYERLAKRDLAWDKIHWFWGDERNVAHEHSDSNAKMVREALLNRVDAPESNIHTVPVKLDDPHSAAAEYERTLRQHFPAAAFPSWDLVLLGMGDDAHTASLFPATKALDQQQRWFVENWVEKLGAFRYTLTAPAINSARQSWFLIAGGGKREAVSHVFSHVRDPHRFPSQLVRPTRWFITQDALPANGEPHVND